MHNKEMYRPTGADNPTLDFFGHLLPDDGLYPAEDVMIYSNQDLENLTRPEDEKNNNVRLLQMKKSNYGSTEPEIRIVWQNGVFEAVQNTVGQNPQDRDLHDETAYLLALKKLLEWGHRPSIHKNQASFAPKLMVTAEETRGVNKTRLEEAQNRLFKREIIANVAGTEGAKSKRTSTRARGAIISSIIRSTAPDIFRPSVWKSSCFAISIVLD